MSRKRQALSRRASAKRFRKGARIRAKNVVPRSTRGGMRL